jgi:ribosomal protein S18 acetylase RimI-like enzyme
MQIRPVEPGEVEALIEELWRPLAERMARLNRYNALTDDARPQALAYRRERLDEDDSRTLVAVDDGALVGYVSAEVQTTAPIFDRGDDLYVSELFVKEGYRRAGIGSDLVAAIEEWGRDAGCETASVSVNVTNTAGKNLYEDSSFYQTRIRYRKDV